MRHPVGPVLQVEIDVQSEFVRILNLAADLVEMLLRLFAELNAAMIFRTFRKEIQNLAAGISDPCGGFSPVNESEDFHPVDASAVFRPFQDRGKRLAFSVGYPCGPDFKPVYTQVRNENPGDLKFFCGSKSDAGRLLPVTQRCIEQFDIASVSGLSFHFCLSFFSVKK